VRGTAGRGQECERVSRKCGRSVKGSAGSGSGAKGVQENGGEEYEWVKWKWSSSVRGSEGSGVGV